MEIKNLRVVNKNNVIAVFDVKFNQELEIFGFKMITGKKGGVFIVIRTVKNWKDEYEPIGIIGKQTTDRIKTMVKDLMEEGVEK